MKNKKNIARWLIPLAGCALLTGAAAWFDLACNGGRLVYPMDSYSFQSSDIPMILALAADSLYIAALCAALIRAAYAQRKREERTAYRVGFVIIIFLLILAAQSSKFSSELTVAVLISGLAVAVALTMFLSEYLLYRYDHDDAMELEGEGE